MSKLKNYINIIEMGSPEYLQTHTTKRILNEEWAFNTTMTRMMSFVEENGICLLSAFRNNKNKNQNMERHILMKKQFQNNDIKVVEVDGMFIENKGQASEKHVEELSLAVPFFPEN